MNVNELTSSIYGYQIGNHSINNNIKSLATKEETTTVDGQSFDDVLNAYALGEGDQDDLINAVKDYADNTLKDDNSDKDKTADVMNILTDAELAKEYLSSKTGINVITSMIENEVASIISGNNE